MTSHEIKPFEMTDEFQACWMAAGRHLNMRIRDAGGSWLRADLPPFREHLSFALGNQLFFLQIVNADARENGWLQTSRLSLAVDDASGIGCLMPMRRMGDEWKPTNLGWGLVDQKSGIPLNPLELVTEEPVYMTPWEIHDVGVQAVRQHLAAKGWQIASWQTDLEVDPSIFAAKDGKFCGFVVRTSDKGPDKGVRPENAHKIAEIMHANGWGAKFVGMKVAAQNDTFDPRLQHLKRKIMRRSPLLLSAVEIEELSQPDH